MQVGPIVVFVLGGVLERFPRLRIVSAENDAAWMAYLMWRMDAMHSRLGALAPVKLSLKPSEYIKRQVYATFINEPVFVDGLHRYPADNIMWSSDYPHTAASWPRPTPNPNPTPASCAVPKACIRFTRSIHASVSACT